MRDAVLLDFVMEHPGSHPQEAGGILLNPEALLQGFQDEIELLVAEVLAGLVVPIPGSREDRFVDHHVFSLDDRPILQEDCPFDGIGKFADISRPGVPLENIQDGRGKSLHTLAHAAADLVQEVGGQGLDALQPFPQGGQLDPEDVDAVIEVLAKAPVRHLFFQVSIGGGNDANIRMDCPVASQPFEGLFFQYAQQFCLQSRAQLTDFI